MPIYVYKCKNEECKHIFEQSYPTMIEGYSEKPECPECGAETKKVIQNVGNVWNTGKGQE